jgi:subtilase family serine protease
VLTDSSTRAAFEHLLLMAGSTGVTMLYSSGDWDDNFPLTGISAPTFPASSPYATGVGGTTLKIGANGQRIGELGWSTGRSFLCTPNAVGVLCTKKQLGTWLPAAFDDTSGGYTSYNYAEPYWQKPVVPSDLAYRNSAVTGAANRVVPDISLDADPGTGFLIGLTETFPSGKVSYGQTRYGGTSLASPLFAGVIADADQVAGVPVGFIDPTIYRMDVKQPSSIMDILPEKGKQANYREDYAGMIVPGVKGVFKQVRQLFWPGPEVYCDGTGNCVSRPQTLTVTKGYDSLTGLGSPGANFIATLGG